MIDPGQLMEYVIRPTLLDLGLWSQPAEDLVMGTAIQESRLTYLHQLGGGPAKGLWQMEPLTHADIWENYLEYRSDLAAKIYAVCKIPQNVGVLDREDALIYNLRYGCALCRVHYLRQPGALPDTLERQAAYWKNAYNSLLGAGTVEEYITNYQRVNW